MCVSVCVCESVYLRMYLIFTNNPIIGETLERLQTGLQFGKVRSNEINIYDEMNVER